MNFDLDSFIHALNDFSTFWKSFAGVVAPLENLANGEDAFKGSSEVLTSLGSSDLANKPAAGDS